MIVVSLRKEPSTIALTGRYQGVEVTLKSLTSVHFARARHAAQAILDDDGRLLLLLAEHELLPKNSVKEWKRLKEDDLLEYAAFMTGVRMWVVSVECGLLGIDSWVGICGENAGEVPVDRQALEVLMQDEEFSRQIMDGLDAVARILRTEEKP